ncbi:MAG: sulfatase [Gammaproteobacteria bacterium]
MQTAKKRRIFVIALLVALSLGAVSAVNYIHIDAHTLNESALTLISKSRKVREQARLDYEREALAALPPNRHIGPFYRLDDGFGGATVLVEPKRPETLADVDLVFSFEFDDEEGFRTLKGQSELELREGTLVVSPGAPGTSDLINASPISIPKDEVGEIAIRVRAKKAKHIKFGWSREAEPREWKNQFAIPVKADDNFHTYFVNAANVLKRGLATQDNIAGLFLRPSDQKNDLVEIDFIRFISKRSEYMRKPRGVGYETIAKEMRPVLYMLPTQTLEYTVDVPKRSPTLEFGCGLLIDEQPITFRVTLTEGDKNVVLYDQSLSSRSQWHDAKFDLTPWAGRRVRLALTVEGSENNVAFWSNPIVSSAPEKPLNVIVILEDALRADHLSAYGYALPTSPFKEQMKKEHGIVFLNAISQATETRPSVPSMMTSLLPSATGVWHDIEMLNDAYLTLAEIMRSQGFTTAAFVQNGNAGPYAGLHQGFSNIFDEETLKATEDVLGKPAMAWIERNRHRNFFLYLHVTDPHGVYDPPSPYNAWYQEISPGKTPVEFDKRLDPKWMRQPTLEGRRRLYDGEIRHNDAVIENFIDRLKGLGLYDHTVLVLTSDHGEHLGERGEWVHHPPGFLQVTHVQLILSYPERYHEGKEITETVQLLDVMPTVLDLAQVESSGLLLQGDSLVGLIEGSGLADWKSRLVVSEEPMLMDKASAWRNEGMRAIGSLFYRGFHLIASRKFFPPEVLTLKVFDISADPEESRPLYRFVPDLYLKYKYASVLNQIQANNIAGWKKWTDDEQAQNYKFDPDVLEHLKGLGYIE